MKIDMLINLITVLQSDKASPITGPVEIHYVPEQVSGKFKIPEEVSEALILYD